MDHSSDQIPRAEGRFKSGAPDPFGPGENPGTRLGRYKLLQKIGEGGCGVVYMAEQEEPVHRRVALKVIKLGMDTREVVARFEAEQQALAMMDHPNIARVFDAGATEAGRPFFVMELVRGIPITSYCDENNLPTPARLGLFMQVCQAVQHAHQKGIIHRDLKPSNILVTVNDGIAVPKVIDFGIARATQGRLTDHTLFTAFEQFIGTPAYMSPEQAEMSSLDVDTRSDIYSLGVLLYELLTGCVPFDAKDLVRVGFDEMRRQIREVEPPRPSVRLSTLTGANRATTARLRSTGPAQLSSLLRGDLDWIVMRCLEKDRRRRYESASGLAVDLQRHLNHEPVTARPPSTAYLLQRLIRRHRFAFISATAIAVTLMLGLGLSTWEYYKEKAARELALAAETKARTEAIKSEQVARFLKEILASVGPWVALGRDTKLLRDILDKTADRIGHDLKDQPEVEAELRTSIGLVYEQLAELEKAEAMLRAALKLRLAKLAPDDPSVANLQLRVAFILTERGDYAAAANFLHEALTTRPNPLAAGLTMEAERRGLAPDAPSWKKYVVEVKLIEQRIVAAGSKGGRNNDRDIAWTIGTIGAIAAEQGDLDMAETSLREALVMQRRLYGPEHEEIAKALTNLGGVAFLRGQYEEAEKTWRETLAMQRKLLGSDHPDIADTLLNLTTAAIARGNYAAAETFGREALAMRRKLFPPGHPLLVGVLLNLGDILMKRDNPAAAEPLFREVLAISGKNSGKQSSVVASALNCLAEAELRQDRPTEAEALAHKALAAWEQADPDAWQVCSTRFKLGVSLATQKKFTEAEPLLLAGYGGLKAREKNMRPDERADELPYALTYLVQFYLDSGQSQKSAEWQQKRDAYNQAVAAQPAAKRP